MTIRRRVSSYTAANRGRGGSRPRSDKTDRFLRLRPGVTPRLAPSVFPDPQTKTEKASRPVTPVTNGGNNARDQPEPSGIAAHPRTSPHRAKHPEPIPSIQADALFYTTTLRPSGPPNLDSTRTLSPFSIPHRMHLVGSWSWPPRARAARALAPFDAQGISGRNPGGTLLCGHGLVPSIDRRCHRPRNSWRRLAQWSGLPAQRRAEATRRGGARGRSNPARGRSSGAHCQGGRKRHGARLGRNDCGSVSR